MSTTDSFPSAAPVFDSGPLSWVMGEIRESLERSRQALEEAAAASGDAQATSLQHARAHLHQAHGALQMVDVDGAPLMTQAAEDAIARLREGSIACGSEQVALVAQSYQALVEYLEELLGGAPPQPARLFPYYRALQELLGAQRIHPADLFFADLSAPVLPSLAAAGAAPDYAACRSQFEKALLPYMKMATQEQQHQGAQPLLAAIAEVAQAQRDGSARTFWMAMQCFAALVVAGQIEGDRYVKQLFGQINLQIRRLSQGQDSQPEAMLHDAMFFIAAASEPNEDALTLRRAYHLGGMVPPDYEKKRYGRIDAGALARAHSALNDAKAAWSAVAGEQAVAGPDDDADAFDTALQALRSASDGLDAPPLRALLDQLSDAVDATEFEPAQRAPGFALAMASALLFVEQALEQIRRLPDGFDQRAFDVGAHMLALAAGQDSSAPHWQDELARQSAQSQTVAVLANEIKSGLKQVEKALDDYYFDAAKHGALAQLDPLLHQIEGALSILDEDAAVAAAGHVRAAVRALAAGAADPRGQADELQNIAQNVGALGFLVDTLGQSAHSARTRFVFDADGPMLREAPPGQAPAAAAAPASPAEAVPEAAAPLAAAPMPVAEDDIEAELLEIFIAEAQEVLAFIGETLPVARAAPSDQSTLTLLRRSFHTLKGSGRMVGLDQFGNAAAAIERVMNQWLSEGRAASADLLELLGSAHADMLAWIADLVAHAHSARDGLALVAAAERVQQGEALALEAAVAPMPADEPAPEAAAEALLDLDLDLAPELVIEAMPVLEPEGLDEAELLAEPLLASEPEPEVEPRPALEPDLSPQTDPELEAFELEFELEPHGAPAQADQPAHALDDALALESTAPAAPAIAPSGATVIEFPVAPEAGPPADDNIKRIGGLEIALPLYSIYLAETDELVRLLTQDFGEWRHEPQRAVSAQAQKAVHTLAGTSATVGFKALRELAYNLEMALGALVEPAPVLQDAQRDLLEAALERARQMLQSFAQGALEGPQPQLVAQLQQLREQLTAQAAAPAPATSGADAALEAKLDILFGATLAAIALSPPELPRASAPPAEDAMGGDAQRIDDVVDLAFDDPFETPALTQAAPELAPAEPVSLDFALDDLAPAPAAPAPQPHDEFDPLLDLMAELPAHAELLAAPAPADELLLDLSADAARKAVPAALPPAPADALGESAIPLELLPEPFEASALAGAASEPEPEPRAAQPPAQAPVLAEFAPAAPELDLLAPLDTVPGAPAFNDDLDPDLLPVFLEEATDLLPKIGASLRAWQHNPADTAPAQAMQRALHTVKGSARMAGAMRLGQHAHELETLVENMVHAGTTTGAAFDELASNYDHALALFERLRNPAAASADDGQASSAAPAAKAAAPDAPRVALVRVRADILDRLVNQAGEVSITRSKLENQVGALKGSLADFSDNLARLRRQLREVEIQAETQIASRMAQPGEREFDPLEFDRFTRLQELTRMMAESINDVASFEDSLSRSIDSAGADLAMQSRLTRDLQRDLMRVRMVPFSSIAERLYSVARQCAKEVDKRVNLDIRGGNVEIDRSVLEQMAAPFEHLLRNAIVHGIEARERRAASGKSETGELLIQASGQGNEVVIEFSDDGAGLDLARIRAKALESGLLDAAAELSDAQAAELIFAPGLSTASTLTELAGRGVGMDVVRSEAQALGGHVDLASEAGKGARFSIHLPLTLAVTQVVLLACGGRTYAVPSILVEQVMQVKEAALKQAHLRGTIDHQGQPVPLRYLAALLGDHQAHPHSQRSIPVLVLHSGAERLALHVDDIIGNREVVIKNVGPQLARMAGIAGATVLGSGEIVLILNPVALAQQAAPAGGAALAFTPEQAVQQRDAVVMVVDDSLTVRRVTQRLLEREGYQVMLAKDGVDALEQMQETMPDLMLVDIEMPRMDGFDLTRNVRGNDSSHAIPIIMITSRTADKHRNYALDLGVNAYFGKPFQEDALAAAIRALLTQKVAA